MGANISRLRFPSVDQELSSVDHCSAQEYLKSTSGPMDCTLKGKISKFKWPKASPTTLNGYIQGKVYKSTHLLEFWSTEKHSFKEKKSILLKHPRKEKKRKKALSLPQIQRENTPWFKSFLFNKSFTPKKIEVPESFKSKQRVSNKSKLIFGDFF